MWVGVEVRIRSACSAHLNSSKGPLQWAGGRSQFQCCSVLLSVRLQSLVCPLIYAARGLQPCSNSQSMRRHAPMFVAPELQIADVGWGRSAHLLYSPELKNNGGTYYHRSNVFCALVCQTPTSCALSWAHGPFKSISVAGRPFVQLRFPSFHPIGLGTFASTADETTP